ncbi:MAG: hypothetical protein J6Y80_02530 [Victivallales bacterium]|nr:hypothetical protein [Victivallales bacterium]
MKKLSFCLSFLLLFALVGATFAQEVAVEEEASSWKPDFELTLDWNSRYVSKGAVINPDPIASVDLWIGLKGFYVDFWAPFDMTDINRPERSGAYTNNRKYRAEEVDYVVGYSYTVGADNLGGLSDLTIDFNYKYWQYPRATFDDDQLLELGVKLDNVLDPDSNFALAFGTSVAYHLNGDYKWWGTAYANLSYKINDQIKIGVKNTWYWGDKRFNRYGIVDDDGELIDVEMERDAINAAELKFYASYSVTDNISLGAFWAAAWAIDHETRMKWDADSPWNRRQNFWGGVSLTLSF